MTDGEIAALVLRVGERFAWTHVEKLHVFAGAAPANWFGASRAPGLVVKGGTAIDHRGRIFVSLEYGRIVCFAAPGEPSNLE